MIETTSQTASRATSESVGTSPESEYPDTRDQQHHGGEHDGDHGQPGDELPIDHVIAVDRLRNESGERSLRPFAVHRIESESDPEQRREEPDEEVERKRDGVGVLCEEQEE